MVDHGCYLPHWGESLDVPMAPIDVPVPSPEEPDSHPRTIHQWIPGSWEKMVGEEIVDSPSPGRMSSLPTVPFSPHAAEHLAVRTLLPYVWFFFGNYLAPACHLESNNGNHRKYKQVPLRLPFQLLDRRETSLLKLSFNPLLSFVWVEVLWTTSHPQNVFLEFKIGVISGLGLWNY